MSEIIKKLHFRKGWYHYYKEQVNGNEEISLQQAQRKITRNMHLAHTLYAGEQNTLYQYGSLKFRVDRRGSIIWMKNKCKPIKGWKVDKVRQKELNRELGIEVNT